MIKPFYTGGYEQAQLCQNQQILEHVQAINMNVQQNNQALQEYARVVDKKLQTLEKNKKRSLENVFIAVQNNGIVLLVSAYDNGDTEGETLSNALTGNWMIYRLKFNKTEQKKEKFLLSFPNSGLYIIGNLCKNTEAGIYDYFVKAGVVFNPQIKAAKVKKALYTTFSPIIENCRNVMEIPELAGWYERKFIHADNYWFTQRSDFPELPILKKHFPNFAKNELHLENYFRLMRGIYNYRDRAVLMALPVMGMMSSLFAQKGIFHSFFVNVVFLDEADRNIFVKLTQIFNREIAEIVRADANDTELRKEIFKYNDEVLIVDASRENLSQYQKKKIGNNVKRIWEKILDNSISYGIQRRINVALMILNNSAECGTKALNLFVDKKFFKGNESGELLYQTQTVDEFLCAFINFIQGHFNEVMEIIANYRNAILDKRIQILELTFEILKRFWGTIGIDLIQEAQLPQKLDFSGFFDNIFDEEDTLKTFMQVVRREIRHFSVLEKGKEKSEKRAVCFFDNENIWIHPQILDRMLGKNGMLPLKLQILSRLKEASALKTDKEGLTRRLQVDGSRLEFYQFERAFFNEFGMTDVVNLGKEGV